MSIVAVPTQKLERQRSVVRHREQLMRNRRRAEAPSRALTLSQGIIAPVGWWRPAAWKEFKTQVPEWMASQLQHWQEEALGIDAKEHGELIELVAKDFRAQAGDGQKRGRRPISRRPDSLFRGSKRSLIWRRQSSVSIN
jgi:hypothetical protein